MKKEFKVHIATENILKANNAGVDIIMPKTHIVTMSLHSNAIPDRVGIYVGRFTDGGYQSNLDSDETAAVLKTYIEQGLVETKVFSQLIGGKLIDIPHYFFMYEVDESIGNRPTYTEDSCGYGLPLTGHYECEYEILLGSEEYTRRMVFKTKSVNISMYEWISALESELEDLEYADEDVKSQFYLEKEDEDDEDGCWMFTMFDNFGLPVEVDFDTDEFLGMIVGIRQLSCRYIDDGKENI